MMNYSALMSKKQVTGMNEKQVPAMDEHKSFKPECPLDFKDSSLVHITIHPTFSDFLEEIGEPEAKEDIDTVLNEIRYRTDS